MIKLLSTIMVVLMSKRGKDIRHTLQFFFTSVSLANIEIYIYKDLYETFNLIRTTILQRCNRIQTNKIIVQKVHIRKQLFCNRNRLVFSVMIIYSFLYQDRTTKHHHRIQYILNKPLVESMMRQQANHISFQLHYVNKRGLLLYQADDKF